MTTDLAIQYTVVGLIILLALGWILYKAYKARRKKIDDGPCASCGLLQNCKKTDLRKKNKCKNN